MEEQRRGAIRDAFYVNQLMMQSGTQMTATEVLQRTEEKMRLLGPVLGRLQSELLQPLITRAFNILLILFNSTSELCEHLTHVISTQYLCIA